MNDETAEADLKTDLKIDLEIIVAQVFDEITDEIKNEIDFDEEAALDGKASLIEDVSTLLTMNSENVDVAAAFDIEAAFDVGEADAI